jgi:DNA polymerase-3 subunit gamma/tau
MPQVLYRKWRPQTWDQVVGQDHVIITLRNALAAGKGSHAYLFAGPRGTGKTTTARILAKAVNCLREDLAERPCGECAHCQAVADGRFLDLIEIDAASNTSVEDVRDLRDKINFSPNQGRYKVYIIDEVHMLSTAAFNALLKTLEEPPPHAIFVLATTEVHKIPATVLSRCQRYEFRRIPVADIVAQLSKLAESEGIAAEPEALTLIARQSTGSLRDAISLLDMLASSGQTITLESAQEVLGTAASQAVLDVVAALVERQPAAGLDSIHAALDAGSDPRHMARQIVDYLRDLLLMESGNASQIEATAEMRLQMARHVQAFGAPELLRLIRVFNTAAETRGAWLPSLPLELAFIEALGSPDSSGGFTPPAATIPPESRKALRIAEPVQSEPPIASSEGAGAAVGEASPGLGASPVRGARPEHGAPSAAEPQIGPQDRQATQTLAESWGRMLAWVRRSNPRAYGLLNSCKSRFIRGDNLVLNFASDLLKSQMEKPEHLDITRQALFQVFQRPMDVLVNVDAASRESIPSGVDEEGMVAAALRDLGGEIVDIQ